MRNGKKTQVGLVGAAITALVIGLSALASGAAGKDLHLQPGTDCSKLLYTERTDCIRQMNKDAEEQAQQQSATGQSPTSDGTRKPAKTVLRLGGGVSGN